MSEVSFEKDIKPVLQQFNGPMIWRLDFTVYEDVKENASIILERISSTDDGGRMPPPPFPPLDATFVTTFQQWINAGYPK